MKFNSVLSNLPIYQPGKPIEEIAKKIGLSPKDIIKLASNENPFGPSPEALEAMQSSIKTAHRYPDGSAFSLKQSLSKHLAIPPSQLILGNGSNELIELIGHALLNPDSNIVVSQYCFAIYPIIAKLFGAEVISVPAIHYSADCEKMAAAVNHKTKIIFIANPNNPTGTLCDPASLLSLIDLVPSNVLIVIDEAYIEYLENPQNLLPLIRKKEMQNLMLMRTFSKAHGLAGLRIGYGIGSPALISELEKVRQPFHCNSIAQASARAALGAQRHLEHSRKSNRLGLEKYESYFQKSGWKYVPSFANFTLLRVNEAEKVFQCLLKKGIITRLMTAYRLNNWIRISVGTEAENERCIDELSQIIPQ